MQLAETSVGNFPFQVHLTLQPIRNHGCIYLLIEVELLIHICLKFSNSQILKWIMFNNPWKRSRTKLLKRAKIFGAEQPMEKWQHETV